MIDEVGDLHDLPQTTENVDVGKLLDNLHNIMAWFAAKDDRPAAKTLWIAEQMLKQKIMSVELKKAKIYLLEEQLREASENINTYELEILIAEYLSTRPADDGEAVYASYQQLAEEQLYEFLQWCRDKQEGTDDD